MGFYVILKNPNITCKIIESNIDKFNMDNECILSFLSENPNICKFIQSHISKPWVWRNLSGNPNITWEFIEQHLDKDWNWQRLSEHPNITWDIIKANPDKNWKWSYVFKNPNITWEIIKDNPSNLIMNGVGNISVQIK